MKTKTETKKWYDLGIEYLLYSLAVFVPAVFHPDFYSAFGAPKLLALRLITMAVIILWGLKIFVEGRVNYRKSWFNAVLAFYGLICVITTVLSSAFYTSLYGAHGRFLGLITVMNLLILPFLVWNFLRDRAMVRRLLAVGYFASGLLALYGILQYFGVWQDQFNWNQDPADRIFGTIGHGNHFGAYLGMNFVLGIFLVREFKNKWIKFLGYAALVAHAATIFLTASRGAIFAVIVALGFCGLAALFAKHSRGELNIGKWLAPAFVTVAVLVSGAVIFKDEIAKFPLVERTAITMESIQQGKIPDRYSWWLSSAEMIKDRPFLGYGLSTFRDIYNEYRRLDYETVEEGDQEAHITPEAAHNEYLNIAAAQGLLGLIAWLAIIFFVIGKVNAMLFEERENPDYYILLGLKGALVVYLVQVFFSFGVISTLTLFFVYLGAALSLAVTEIREREFKLPRAGRVIACLILLVIAGVGTACTLRETGADYFYKSAMVAGAKFDNEGAMNHFESAIALMPNEYAYRQALGDFALTAAQPVSATETRQNLLNRAVSAYEDALKINVYHPSVYYNLGVAQIELFVLTKEQKYYDDAVKNLDESVVRALNNPLYPYQVAKAFMQFTDGKSKAGAIRYFLEALESRENYRDTNQILEQLTGKQF